MTKVTFTVDFESACRWAFFYSTYRDWFKEMGYNNANIPNLPVEVIDDAVKNRTNCDYDMSFFKSEFSKIYDESKESVWIKPAQILWSVVENDFFKIVQEIVGKKYWADDFSCCITRYGTGGAYQLESNQISVHPDMFISDTIMHEMTHMLIEDEIRKNDVDHATKERIVELYLIKTPISELFLGERILQYKAEQISSVDAIFEKTYNIYEIMEELKKQ